jgi:hypothetical protein
MNIESLMINGVYLCEECKKTSIVKSFNTYAGLANHLGKIHKIKTKDYITEYVFNKTVPKCKCGCGQDVLWDNTKHKYRDYRTGHNGRGKTKESDETVNRRGRNISRALKGRPGRKQTEETKTKIGKKVSYNWKRGLYDNKIFLTHGYKNGWYTSKKSGTKYHYQSSWEKEVFLLLDQTDNLKWSRYQGSIKYSNNKKYYPDILFEINDQPFIVEIKGRIDDENSKEIIEKEKAVKEQNSNATYLFITKFENSFVIIDDIPLFASLSYQNRKKYLEKCILLKNLLRSNNEQKV